MVMLCSLYQMCAESMRHFQWNTTMSFKSQDGMLCCTSKCMDGIAFLHNDHFLLKHWVVPKYMYTVDNTVLF